MIAFIEPEMTVEAIRKNLRAAVDLPLPPDPTFKLLIAVLQGAATVAGLDRANFSDELAKIDCDGARLVLFESRIKAAEQRQLDATLLLNDMNNRPNFNPSTEEEPHMTTPTKPVSEKQAAYFAAKLKGIKELTGLDVSEKSLDWPRQVGGIYALKEGERAAAEYDFEQAKIKDEKWKRKNLIDYINARQYAAAQEAKNFRQKQGAAMLPSL